jgi:hypothetical protein
MPIAANTPSPATTPPVEPPVDRPASKLIPESARSLRTRIYNFIRDSGTEGATCEEAELALRLSHQTCSARCAELRNHPVHGGRIMIKIADGKKIKRATVSGRSAYVYVVVPQLTALPLT